jgi:hypothetical protein
MNALQMCARCRVLFRGPKMRTHCERCLRSFAVLMALTWLLVAGLVASAVLS